MHNDSPDLLPDMAPPPPPPPPPSPRASRRHLMSRRTATAAVAGGLVVGGIAGGYVITQAATPSASATPGAATGSPHGPFGHGFAGAGPAARTQDLQQVAAAIGISTTQLQTEMSAGKTISAIAKEHNVSAATVISKLVADENAEIDAAVAAGQLSSTQAAQLKTMTAQRVTAMVNGTMPPFGPGGRGGFGGPGGFRGGMNTEDEQVVAGAIGISSTQLQTELSAAKSIAAIAKEHNVATATVISAWVASENAEIDQRVSSGQMTAAQGAQAKSQTTQRVTDEVNGTRDDGGPPGPWGGPPPGAPGSGDAPTR